MSDRRLTWLNGPLRGQVKEDERNKAVFVDGRFAFGYTGLAEVGSVRTDDWLANLVGESRSTDMSKILVEISDKATEAFRSIGLPADLKRHAFQGVGWAFDARFPGAVPSILTVSNAIGKSWGWLPTARDAFAREVKLFPTLPDGFVLMSIGQEISKNHQAAVWRLIRRCARRSAPPWAFLRSLLIGMRWLAHRYPSIGPGLMALSIPKKAAESFVQTGRMRALMTGPLESYASFYCFGPDGRAQLYGPHAAIRGVVVTKFTVTPLP